MHPATEQLLSYFTYLHLPTDAPHRKVSAAVCELAFRLAEELPESPETTAGLRKLLEAKDCFVRAALP